MSAGLRMPPSAMMQRVPAHLRAFVDAVRGRRMDAGLGARLADRPARDADTDRVDAVILEPREGLRGWRRCPAMRNTAVSCSRIQRTACADLVMRAVGRVEAHDPAAGLDDARETLAVVARHAERRCERSAGGRDLAKLGRLLVDRLEAREDAERAVLAERHGTCRRRRRPASASRSGEPSAAAARNRPWAAPRVRCASVERTRGTSDTSSKSKARGMSAKQVADRLSDETVATVCITSLWNTRQMSELADRATDIAARIAELQGHL